jgi:hypothetical protein
MVVIESVRNLHQPALQIDSLYLAGKKTGVLQQLSNRVHNVRKIEVAGGNLVQHGSEQEEVVPVDEGNLDVRAARERAIVAACNPAKPPPRMRIRVLCSAVTWLQLLYFGKHLDGGGGSLLLSFESPIELFRRNYARGYSSSSGSPVQPAPGLRRDIPAVMEWQPSLPTEECLFWLRSCSFLLNQDCVPIRIPHLSAP